MDGIDPAKAPDMMTIPPIRRYSLMSVSGSRLTPRMPPTGSFRAIAINAAKTDETHRRTNVSAIHLVMMPLRPEPRIRLVAISLSLNLENAMVKAI